MAAPSAFNVPVLLCEESAGTLAFVLDMFFLLFKQRLSFIERMRGGLTSAQSFFCRSLLCVEQ